jgi:hypothetical protein
VLSFYPNYGPGWHVIPRGVHPTITFNPAAMPAGAELSFGVFQLRSGEQLTDFVLINTSSYTCASTPPQTLPANGAQFQLLPARS